MKPIVLALLTVPLLVSCTQEVQNKLGREVQNWTGTDGVLDIYAGEKLVNRFIKIVEEGRGQRAEGRRFCLEGDWDPS